MIEFIYSIGAFLFDCAVWVCGMTITVGITTLIVAFIKELWKHMTRED